LAREITARKKIRESQQSRHHDRADSCPLSRVKRTSIGSLPMSAFDPKRT
jgi:hypothetical protein